MSIMRRRKGWMAVTAAVLILGLAALVGVVGCGGAGETSTTAAGGYHYDRSDTTAAPYTTTTAGATTTMWAGEGETSGGPASTPSYDGSNGGTDIALAGTLTALEAASGQKIISDVQIAIEVEKGKFQMVFDQALQLASRYGGYLVSSNSYASDNNEGDSSMRSGTVAIRVPSTSFIQALSDARKLGELKNESLSSQDVTEEYVDLEARIKNSEAHVASLVALLGKAKTIDEILQVQSVLTYAQQDLEALKGRMRFLQEHTSYSTITMSIYEAGVQVVSSTEWGVKNALSGAVHNLVKAFNAIIRGLGVLVPVLVILAIIGYIVYRIVRAVLRRNRQREQARYQPIPQGWSGQAMQAGPGVQPGGMPQPGTASPASPASGTDAANQFKES